MEALPNKECEFCGKWLIADYYMYDGEAYWYYEHSEPWDCIKYLRDQIQDIQAPRKSDGYY